MIFLIVAAVFGAQYLMNNGNGVTRKPDTTEPVTLTAFVGGEKTKYLANPEVIRILKEKYGITLNAVKAGSIEMASTLATDGKDALWPSNQIAVEIYKNRGAPYLTEETIFNSPLVFYAYDIVTDALIREGVVAEREGINYITDTPRLIRYIRENKTWKDIGLPQIFGKIGIYSTDPTRSNSGNMFAGLLANLLNGDVLTEANLTTVMPQVTDYFNSRGYMESSSGDIFKSFITTGVGAKPMIVGYESQMVEFTLENEAYRDFLRQKIHILYPEPTVWSSHPLIALTPSGKRLIEALKDKDLQRIAWEQHGFRSGLLGGANDPAALRISGIPKEIKAVMPMPSAAVMEKIITALAR